MGKHEKPTLPLYERDFAVWTTDQAAKLRKRAHNEIDWENVAEEIESLGRRDRREIQSRMKVLIVHLLKWELQAGRRSHSWQSSISEQRIWIGEILKDSPSLRRYPGHVFRKTYDDAVAVTARETGFGRSHFPSEPPFTSSQMLDPRFWPGEPLSVVDTIRD